MLEQLLPMFQDPVQAAVQPVLLRYREIHAQQDVHRALIEPLPVHTKLTSWFDQPVHHQQLQHLRPVHLFSSWWQFLFPEPIQLQLSPQLASQPAVAVRPCAPQLHLAQLHLDRIHDISGSGSIFGEKTQRCGTLLLLIEHLQSFAPC